MEEDQEVPFYIIQEQSFTTYEQWIITPTTNRKTLLGIFKCVLEEHGLFPTTTRTTNLIVNGFRKSLSMDIALMPRKEDFRATCLEKILIKAMHESYGENLESVVTEKASSLLPMGKQILALECVGNAKTRFRYWDEYCTGIIKFGDETNYIIQELQCRRVVVVDGLRLMKYLIRDKRLKSWAGPYFLEIITQKVFKMFTYGEDFRKMSLWNFDCSYSWHEDILEITEMCLDLPMKVNEIRSSFLFNRLADSKDINWEILDKIRQRIFSNPPEDNIHVRSSDFTRIKRLYHEHIDIYSVNILNLVLRSDNINYKGIEKKESFKHGKELYEIIKRVNQTLPFQITKIIATFIGTNGEIRARELIVLKQKNRPRLIKY